MNKFMFPILILALLSACQGRVETPPPSVAESPAPTVAQTEEVNTDTSPEPSILPSGEKPDFGDGFIGTSLFAFDNIDTIANIAHGYLVADKDPGVLKGTYRLSNELEEDTPSFRVMVFCNGLPIPYLVDGKEGVSQSFSLPAAHRDEKGTLIPEERTFELEVTPQFSASWGDNQYGKIDVFAFWGVDGYAAQRMVMFPWGFALPQPTVKENPDKMLWVESKTSRPVIQEGEQDNIERNGETGPGALNALYENIWNGDKSYVDDPYCGLSYNAKPDGSSDDNLFIDLHGGKTVVYEASLRLSDREYLTDEERAELPSLRQSRFRTVFFWDDKPIKLPGGKEYIEWQAGADKSATYEFDVSDYLDDKPHSFYAVSTRVDIDWDFTNTRSFETSDGIPRYKITP